MTDIFLSVILLSSIILFIISQSLAKFSPSRGVRYGTLVAYLMQFIGLIGLIIYHVDFLQAPPLEIQFEANSPDFIRASAEILWPISALCAVFWFLPQILDFLKDPRKSVPVLAALSGRHTLQEQQTFLNSSDTKKLREYGSLDEAHRETVDWIEKELETIPEAEQKGKLLIFAADRQLLAEFERSYNLIYGSQIQALQILLNNSDADISSFYDLHKEKTENVPDARHASFKEWVQILLDAGLAKESSGKFCISNKGKMFLKFLKERNYYLLKAF